MIRVEKLTKVWGDRTVLEAVSVHFEKGKVSSIVGPSGGGKSTLLRCINGLERFDSGSIKVGADEIGPKAAERLLRDVRRRVGMVFQHYGLFAHMTAVQNVMEAPVHVRGVTRDDARARARELLDKVGLLHRRDAFPREMSGGEQQRVAIARALAMDPEALLLDEPTSALDPERKAEVVKVMRDLANDGTTMVIVTHDEALARDLSDRVVTLRGGRIATPDP